MANEQSGAPLRRWRPFYGAFVAIDDAIEAAGHPRAAFQDTRVRILKLLRAATDDGMAEQLCAALDDTMVEALKTLRMAPIPHSVLASADLARAVRALRKHGSARIRGLAGDVVRGWKTANAAARAATDNEIDKLSGDPIPCQDMSTMAVAEGNVRAPVVPATATKAHKMKLHVLPAKILPGATTEEHKKKLFLPPAKMKPIVAQSEKLETKKPVVAQSMKLEAKKPILTQSQKMEAKKPIAAQSEKMEAKKLIVTQSEKMETTKRKLFEGYQEAEKVKRQHTSKKIEDKEAMKMFERSQRKMHRAPARCRISSGVHRSLLPSLQLV